MFNLIIFGPPGAGKGTQAEIIAQEFNLVHLSSGALLRQELDNGELGAEIKRYQDAGELVPDSLMVTMIEKAIIKGLNKPGFIFDGYPRNLNQAKSLDEFLNKNSLEIALVLNLDLNKDEAVKRIMLRGQTSGRSDDNITTIENRFETYQKETIPILDYYQTRNIVTNINGQLLIPEVTEQIMAVLKKLI